MNNEVTIKRIDYSIIGMQPIIVLDNGRKIRCAYNDSGESSKTTARRQLDKLIGRTYKNINTLRWYLTDKSGIVKKAESKLEDSYITYDDDDEVYVEEINYKAELARAKRLFGYHCKDMGNEKLLNKIDDWTLRDFVSEAQYQADYYKDLAMDKYGYTIRNLQTADIHNTAKEAFQVVVNWRKWQRFVNSFSSILNDDIVCSEEHLSKWDLL